MKAASAGSNDFTSVPTDIVYSGDRQIHEVDVSIITPAYNPTADLLVAAASIARQKVKAIEWIIVDDASHETCRSLFDQARTIAKCSVTLLRHTGRQGQAQARNTGFRHASGRFVKNLDADDAFDPHHLERLLDAAAGLSDPRAIVVAPTRHVFVERGTTEDNLTYRDAPKSSIDQLTRMLTRPFFMHSGALLPRTTVAEVGGYDPSLTTDEDGDFLFRLLLAGYHFKPVEGVFYLYRHNGRQNRVSRNDTVEKINARRAVCFRVLKHFKKTGKGVPNAIERAICQRLDDIASHVVNDHPDAANDLLADVQSINRNFRPGRTRLRRLMRQILSLKSATGLLRHAKALRETVLP